MPKKKAPAGQVSFSFDRAPCARCGKVTRRLKIPRETKRPGLAKWAGGVLCFRCEERETGPDHRRTVTFKRGKGADRAGKAARARALAKKLPRGKSGRFAKR